MDYRQQIAETLQGFLGAEPYGVEKSAEEILALLEIPKDSKLGDHAFPCFVLAKALRQAPPKIAEGLADAVGAALVGNGFSRVDAVGPYLNFTVDKAGLAAEILPRILSGDFLAPRPPKGERVMIEYSQPNTHKAFHVGHTRNVALGDCLVRLYEWAGYEVVAANYIGDVGAHIAKCLWYFREHYQGDVPETNRGEFLGELYTRATELLDFTTLTQTPHPGVVAAQVLEITPHPTEEKWKVVRVATGTAEKSVVCGGTGFSVGDIVAYATRGSRVGGRQVQVADKKGVPSDGMICSVKEISLGDDRNRIAVLPAGSALGEEIAEVLRVPDALPADRSVLDEMREREEGVRRVLKSLESGEPEITAEWRETRQWSLDEFNTIYAWLGARFDHFFYESDVGDAGKQIVKEYLDKGVLVHSEGAIGADLKPYKLPFFLLLKSDGTGLYSTKDIALARLKFDEFKIQRSVYVVDSRQSLHFEQVFKTLELMGYERARQCYHLAYGFVSLPEGQMSSRTGNIILFSQLRQRLTDHTRREFLNKYQGDWSEEEITEAARQISIGTIKYGMLNQDAKRDIVFDLEEWTAKTGNTGPYLMYAYTRTCSILREVGEIDRSIADVSLLVHEMEMELLRGLQSFPDVALQSAETYQPHLLCSYLYDLARDFSRMYQNCSVLKAETPELQATRADLVDATGRVLGRGLELLGIQPLERM